jgi:hypothetical protein
MRQYIHLMMVTSISMIITFILHCIMEHVPSRNSFSRFYLIDYLRDYGLMLHCYYNKGIRMYRFRLQYNLYIHFFSK